MSTKIQFKRLIKLAEHLENLKPTKTKVFDMQYFKRDYIENNICKTAACALGEACTIPSFKKAGLKICGYERIQYLDETIRRYYVVYKDKKINTSFMDFDAASRFFGIPLYIACKFFDPYEYPGKDKITPKKVAKRIREFVKEELAKKGK